MTAEDAEQAAEVIEDLFEDLQDLRNESEDESCGMRTHIAVARVSLLNLMNIARGGDLKGEDTSVTITIRDGEDDAVEINVEFEPPMDNPFTREAVEAAELTPAQIMAGNMMAYAFKRQGEQLMGASGEPPQ